MKSKPIDNRTKAEKIKEIMGNREMRITFCEHDFFYFLLYYASKHLRYHVMAEFHRRRADAVSANKNIEAEGMREIGKSVILGLWQDIWRIVYRKNMFIINLCYDKRKATAFNRIIANELLTNDLLKADFGLLYPISRKDLDKSFSGLQEGGVSEFVATNGVKVKAFGMGESIRGELHTTKDFGAVRPSHLLVDDIDNNRNTRNPNLIEEDMWFIQEEVFGGLSGEGHTITWLGNVIRRDGRTPRMRSIVAGKENWVQFSNFLYGEAGKTEGELCWSRFTIEPGGPGTKTVSKLKEEQLSGFAQNSLGIPRVPGERLFKNAWVNYFDQDLIYEKIFVGVDPASSLKTTSDAMALVVVGQIQDQFFVLDAIDLEGEEKDEENVKLVVSAIYATYQAPSFLFIIESNNGGELYGRILKKMGLPVKMVVATKDKITRFKEKEGVLSSGKVSYKRGKTEGLVLQLLEFSGEPGGDDDMVDALVHALPDPTISRAAKGLIRI